ncbi:MAG TPA: hypothetical protein ENK23_01640 [Sorangium sp.]|nr:hypothetical protein [Sorangium sp.]
MRPVAEQAPARPVPLASIDETQVGGHAALAFDDYPMTIATRPMPVVPDVRAGGAQPAADPQSTPQRPAANKTLCGGFIAAEADVTLPMEAVAFDESVVDCSLSTLQRTTRAARAVLLAWDHVAESFIAADRDSLGDAYGLLHLLYERLSRGGGIGSIDEVTDRFQQLDDAKARHAQPDEE